MARMSEFTFLSSDGQTALSAREYLPEETPSASFRSCTASPSISPGTTRLPRFSPNTATSWCCTTSSATERARRTRRISAFFSEENGWEKAVQDIRSLHDKTAAKYPGKPYFIFGHSMGSFLTRTYLIRFRTGLDGAVISGTGHQSPALVSAGKVMSAIDIRRNGSMHKSDFLNKMAFGTYNDKFENPAPRATGSAATRPPWISITKTRSAALSRRRGCCTT